MIFNVEILILNLKISTLNIRDTLYIRTRKGKTQQTIPKVDPGTEEKTWCVNCNNTIKALHFVQYDALWSIEHQYCFSVPHITSYRTQ